MGPIVNLCHPFKGRVDRRTDALLLPSCGTTAETTTTTGDGRAGRQRCGLAAPLHVMRVRGLRALHDVGRRAHTPMGALSESRQSESARVGPDALDIQPVGSSQYRFRSM